MTDGMDRRIVRSPWRRRLLAIGPVAAVAIAAVLALLVARARPSLRTSEASLTIDTVQQGVFHDLTSLRGNVEPRDTYYLDALEGGQVSRVLAKAGDLVVVGQPLLLLRNSDLELGVLEREGRLVESITQLQAYKKSLEDTNLSNKKAAADIDFNIVRLTRAADRREQLVQKGYVAQEAEDQYHDELDHYTRLRPIQASTNRREAAMTRQQLPTVNGDIVNLQKSLKITRGELDALVVRAPVAGQLTNLAQNVGQNFNRGERLGEVIPNTGSKVAAHVDEFYLGRVHPGQTASVTVNGQPVALTVERVYPQVKDGSFPIDLSFLGRPPAGLSPGQAVEGELTLGGDQPALVLPAGAFLERSGGAWAMVVNGDTAQRRDIRIGRRNARQVEVLSGLRPGDRVITSDYTGYDKVDRLLLTK